MIKLKTSQIKDYLKTLNSPWVLMNNSLHRAFIFKDFEAAFSFITHVAEIAEELNHHPRWENEYNKVDIALYTHDADGITEKDFILAQKIDQIVI